MERFDYFVRRLMLMVPTFIGITLACFTLIQFVPGGPVEQAIMKMRGFGQEALDKGAHTDAISPEQRQALIRHYGFDKPLLERYWTWLTRDCVGLKMESYKFPNKTAWQMILDRIPVSLVFGVTGFLLSYLICIPLGIAKALRHGGAFDAASSLAVFAGYALPAFAFGMVLKMLLCGTTDWAWDLFPLAGFQSDHFDSLTTWGKTKDIFAHMFLPVSCYMIGNFAVLTVLMKNSLLEQVGADYIRTVLAKGGTMRRAVWGHALRNALIPIATGFGSILTLMFAGSVIIEQVFDIPGMGRLSLEAIVSRDYPVFMGILSLTSILGLLGNVLSDLCYVLIDPRIDFQK